MAYSFSNPQIETLSKLLGKLNSEMSVADAKKQGTLRQSIDDLSIQLDSIKADELRYSLVKRAIIRQSIPEGSQAQRKFDSEYEQDYAEYLRCLGVAAPKESAVEFRTRIVEADRPDVTIRPSEKWAADIVDLRSRGFSDEEIVEIIKSRGGKLQTIAVTPQNAEAQEVQAIRQAIKNEQEVQAQQQATEAEREKFYSTAREQSLKDRERAYDAAKKVLDAELASGEIKSREYNKRVKAIEANQSKLAHDKVVFERSQKSAEYHKKIAALDAQIESLGNSELDQEKAVNLHMQRDKLQNELLQGSTVSGESIDTETALIADKHKHDRNQERFGWATPAFITRNREKFEAAAEVREKRQEARDNKKAAEKRIAEITKERDEIKAQLKKENLDAEEKAELETRNAELAKEQQKQEIARQEAKDAQQQNSLRQEFKKFRSSSKKNSKKVEETLINALFLLMLFGPQITDFLKGFWEELSKWFDGIAAKFGWDKAGRQQNAKDKAHSSVSGSPQVTAAVTRAAATPFQPYSASDILDELYPKAGYDLEKIKDLGFSEEQATRILQDDRITAADVRGWADFLANPNEYSAYKMQSLSHFFSPEEIEELLNNRREEARAYAEGTDKMNFWGKVTHPMRWSGGGIEGALYKTRVLGLDKALNLVKTEATNYSNRYDNTVGAYIQATGESTAQDTWTDAEGVHVFFQDSQGNVTQKVIPEQQYREAVGATSSSEYTPSPLDMPGSSFVEQVQAASQEGVRLQKEAQTQAITSIQSISYTSVNYQQYAGLGNNFNP